jgi:transposase
MEVVLERCAGLDVHKKTVVACALTPQGKEIKTFGTMTADLRELAEWLRERAVSDVAMESSGVYWQPVFNVLEGMGLKLLVANAHHIKAVPGRKTDVKDAEWIADLLRHGLLRPSFIPQRDQRELRELTRHRRSLIQERSQVRNRIQKLLEGVNLKLGSVISDVAGVSGRAILRALAQGETDQAVLAELTSGSVRHKRDELIRALDGSMGEHQRLLLGSLLRQMDFLDEEIAAISGEVARRTVPFEEKIERLDTVPGIGRRSAEDILAEIGTDMSRFPTAAHLASWARLCPANHESAGKRKAVSSGHGNRWLRSALTQAALAAANKKDSYFRAHYQRLAARRGKKRAAVAGAHSLLVVIYHLLLRPLPYSDLGPLYFDERKQQSTINAAVRRIERFGYRVSIVPAPA